MTRLRDIYTNVTRDQFVAHLRILRVKPLEVRRVRPGDFFIWRGDLELSRWDVPHESSGEYLVVERVR